MPENKSAIRNQQSAIENLDCLSNDFTLAGDWLRIPFGDHPHPSGPIQRLSRPAAETMVTNFKSFAGRLGRLFGGIPIFIGHPDDPRLANEYRDKKAYGWIMDMEARPDVPGVAPEAQTGGLYLKTKWSAAGEELLSNAHYKWFSPFWGCKDIGRENGRRLVEPVRLTSLGLTNSPNIQGIVPLANEEEVILSDQQSKIQNERPAMKTKLVSLLGLANDASGAEPSDDAVIAAVSGLKSEVSDLKSQSASAEKLANDAHVLLVNEQTERKAKETSLQTALANERRARVDLILDNAIAAGKITAAQRPQWASDLENDFDAKLVSLSNAKPALPTDSKTQGLGARNAAVAAGRDASIRRDKILTLVNERMTKTGEDYELAFANVRKEHAAEFAEMQQPGAK